MSSDLEKITAFIEQHHVMSLATTHKDELSVCSLFYTYIAEEKIFIVASSPETLHMKLIEQSDRVAGNIVLETDRVGEIRGVQFRGIWSKIEDSDFERAYFKKFPYALALLPKLWQIKVDFFKMTDNRLGFGKKLIWKVSSL